MTIEDYLVIRETTKSLAYKILNTNDREDTIFAAMKLDFWDGEKMVFDTEQEMDILMDYLLYESGIDGKKLIDLYLENKQIKDELEKVIIHGMKNYYSSFFEVTKLNKKKGKVEIIDLFDKNYQKLELMDIGLSQTGQVGMIFFSRLISVMDIKMTSGVLFGFHPTMKDKLLSEVARERFKHQEKMNSNDFLF